jgi:(R,R)-butanediol dehydrogenase/meso-butanediol dehydrogenase/diacetyl reductase
MRGVVFKGNRTLDVMTFDDPKPGRGEVVVKMKASGMCGSDLHYYRAPEPNALVAALGLRGFSERGMDPHTPIIAGHEPCGVVEEMGPGTESCPFKPGDRVIVYHYEGCGFCDHCRTGWAQMCDDGCDPHGAVKHGGHADYQLVPASTLVKLPDEISFESGAAIACGTGTAFGAIVRLGLSARDSLAVFGLGPVGLSAVQLAVATGAEVFGVDISAERVAKARELGAAHAINGATHDPVEEIRKLTAGRGVTCAMDCAGGKVAKQQAVRSTAPWGRIALVAVGGDLEIDSYKDLIAKQRTVFGSWTFSQVGMKDCALFIAGHGVEVDKIFSDRWDIAEARRAYENFDRQAGGKGVFVFD